MILRICTIILLLRHYELILVGGYNWLIKCRALALHALRNVLTHQLAVLLVASQLLDFFALPRSMVMIVWAIAFLQNLGLLITKRYLRLNVVEMQFLSGLGFLNRNLFVVRVAKLRVGLHYYGLNNSKTQVMGSSLM
jgi:hypothetical protein